ncbi:MAG: TadE family protein [Methylococcales bacterium]
MNINNMQRGQLGAETVEFVIVFGFWMMLIMAVLDFGRVLYTYNMLTEVTRRGARMAVVCPSNDPAVTQAAIFNDIQHSVANSSLLLNLKQGHIGVQYFNNASGVPEFAQVSIKESFKIDFLIPYIANAVDHSVPTFRTTLYMESNGINPRTRVEECAY